jgi:hypothetical protein
MRFVLALIFIVALAPLAHAASSAQTELMASIPDGKTLTFRAYIDDTDLGTHTIRWTSQGDTITATIEIDLGARVLFLPVYSYKHRSQETWRDGHLVAISTTTNDDGDKFAVTGALKGEAFDVKATAFTGMAPLPIAPTSYWAYTSLKKPNWLNTQSGALLKAKITPKGVETVKTRAGQVKARRYDVTGGLDITLWYDDKNRWVKSRFVASGNTITYVLQ